MLNLLFIIKLSFMLYNDRVQSRTLHQNVPAKLPQSNPKSASSLDFRRDRIMDLCTKNVDVEKIVHHLITHRKSKIDKAFYTAAR